MTERVIALDPMVTTWGVATPRIGGFIVRAYQSQEDAEIHAGLAGKVTTPYVHPKTGAAEVGIVDPLVYHHPEGRWVFAATGWDVPTGQGAAWQPATKGAVTWLGVTVTRFSTTEMGSPA